MSTINISLPDDLKSFIEEQVASGAYLDQSACIQDMVRHRTG